MNSACWKLSAVDLATLVRERQISAIEATQSVLARIHDVNPRINALAEVMSDQALNAASAADQALASGAPIGPLHGVPVSIKVNVDTVGHATTDGVVAFKDHMATSDSPLVASLRAAGAIIVGRSNTPALSVRWFTDNDLHGRTLNPFNAGVTPGGSSGGAAAAVACGMGAIAHGNDYGGSVRYPAWACGVVGLRTTAGRIPSYQATAPDRTISLQQMSVQGPLTRTVADARLALQVMAQGSALDPQWVPAPLEYADSAYPVKVALFRHHPAYAADPSVLAALDQAAAWLKAAGYEVEDAVPPHFEEACALWRHQVAEDTRRGQTDIERYADAASRAMLQGCLYGLPKWDAAQVLEGQVRRFNIARDWSVFLEKYPVLLMPNSWEKQFPIDDDQRGQDRLEQMVRAQSPLLCTAMLGLPGLSVPTGMSQGLPQGVQLVSTRFREDRLLRAGEVIEQAANFQALAHC